MSKKVDVVLQALEPDSWLEKLSQYGKHLAWGLAIIVALLILGSRWFIGKEEKAISDYLAADQTMEAIIRGGAQKPELVQTFVEILHRHPELNAKYDGLLAQVFLNQNETVSALNYGTQAINRTQEENGPNYSGFSQTTLLIANQEYASALKNSQELLVQLEQSAAVKKEELLWAFTLMRIAALQHALGQTQEELKSWKQWQAWYAKGTPAALQLQQYFEENQLPIATYAERLAKKS